MPTIDLLAERVAPVHPQASVAEVYNWFSANPDALALPVVENGRPVGLIDRQDFLLKLAEPLGHSRYGSRPIEKIMDPEPAVVSHDTKVHTFSDIVLKSSAGTMMRGFIVTKGGNYWGVGTVISLLRLANDAQARAIGERDQQIANLMSEKASSPHIASAKSGFVDLVERELKSPLQSIQTFADMLGRQPLPALVLEQVAAIRDASHDALERLNSARDLVHLEHGQLQFDLEPTLIRSFVDEIANTWTTRGAQDGVSIIVSYEGDTELTAMLDRPRFARTVNTLIENALRLVRNGIIEVGLKAEVHGNQVCLGARVRDDGPGLDADQLKNWQSEEGLHDGMDLTAASLLLKAFGGRIWAENNQGRGATYAFDVNVSRAIVEDTPDENVTHLERLDINSHPHVLIADDNATNRVVAQALCEMFGCTCETVEDGQYAVEAIQTGRFDMVLMDIKMPRMDGVQATRAIRAMGGDLASLPIIALTANADPDDALGYVAAGMMCVVEKPIKPERLRMAMVRALSGEVISDNTTVLRQVS
ncbi:response regulator [Brevundimonas sp.]|uniref:response regulator n=1 Tax=Brevundimonas sp. TaxID=1871086 RepID=UPI0028998B03|nr:response regulator [Brevundimonas sp.]